MPLNDGSEIAELHESNVFEIQSLRTTYKAALELIEELDATVAELLVSLESIVNAGRPTRPTSQEWAVMKALAKIAIRKAKER